LFGERYRSAAARQKTGIVATYPRWTAARFAVTRRNRPMISASRSSKSGATLSPTGAGHGYRMRWWPTRLEPTEQLARPARVAVEGMTLVGRDKQVRAHPLLAIERSAIASYQRQLKTLGIKF
jgi:hypothetical protein